MLPEPFRIEKGKIYFEDDELTGIDLSTTEYLGGGYLRDARHVFFEVSLIDGADIATFEIISKKFQFARDKNNVYASCWPIKGIKLDSIEHLGGEYVGDGINIFYNLHKLKNVERTSFQTKGRRAFALDKQYVYWHGDVIKDADPKTFHLLDEINAFLDADDNHNDWAIDKHALYNSNGKLRINIDAETFTVLNRWFGKDSERVVCFCGSLSGRQTILRGVDPDSFVVVEEDLGRDEKAWFWTNIRMTNKELKKLGCDDENSMHSYMLEFKKPLI